MDLEQIKETDIWTLFDKSADYCRMIGMYSDTDTNYRMYNGDQWERLIVEGIEKIQLNFIKPIVKYKTGTILTNLYAIHYSSENFENRLFRKSAEKICKLLNKKTAKFWENDYLDFKIRRVAKDAAINDEGVIYSYYDSNLKQPINEVLNKNDVYYGNENDSEIQKQPYILIKQRKPVLEVQEIAKQNKVPEDKIKYIIGDLDSLEEAGEQAKYEKDNMCTLVTKLYKQNGTVYFSQSTKFVEIKKDTNTGLKYYPVAHMIWEDKVGSARGEGEVRHLIPNQLETNKTAMRRALSAKNTAYPQKVVNIDKISNPNEINRSGSIIKISGGTAVDDIHKVFANIPPSQMSPDVEKLQTELINSTRELAGAGDIVTGQVDPRSASGRAILAVQQAAQQPLTEQLSNLKRLIEDLARIWLDILTVYAKDGLSLEEEVKDPATGEDIVNMINIPQVALREIQATVKVDITPKSSYDKWAQEQSMENLLKAGYFSPQRLGELKLYVSSLDDDSVMPKQKLLDLIKQAEEEQAKISQMQGQAQMLQQRADKLLSNQVDISNIGQLGTNLINQATAS